MKPNMNELRNLGTRPRAKEGQVYGNKFTPSTLKSLVPNVATLRCVSLYQYGLALSTRQKVRVGSRGLSQQLHVGKKNATGIRHLKKPSRVKEFRHPNSWQNGRDLARNPAGAGGCNGGSMVWRMWLVLLGQSKQLQTLDKVKELTHNLVRLVARQCEVHTSERIRRGLQMYSMYSRLWGEEAVCCMLKNLRRSLFAQGRNLLLSAVCFTGFDWQRDGISDKEMKSYEDDVDQVERLRTATVQCESCGKRQVIDQLMPYVDYCSCGGRTGYCGDSRYYDSWEPFIERDHVLVWRKRHHVHNHLYAYKVYGSYDDVCVTAFAEVQLNTQYRTVWDSSALDLRVIDAHPESNSDLVYWLVKFPHFFANRDYVFKRRYTVNHEKKCVVILNKVTEEYDGFPEVKGVHRVREYWSVMVIKAREDFDKPGIEYTLTYFDNPGTSLPQRVTNFIASTGMPDFLRKVHEAALSLQDQAKEGQEVYHHLPEVLLKQPVPAVLPVAGEEEEELIKESVESVITNDHVRSDVPISSDVVSETPITSGSINETPVSFESEDVAHGQMVVISDAAEEETNMSESITAVGDPNTYTAEGQCQESQLGLVEIVDNESSPPIIEDAGSQTKFKTVEHKEELESKDRLELCCPDLAVKVPGKGKEVIVNILEAMEVVSPELEKTVIVQKIEELKARAVLFKENAILKKQKSLESMAALQKKRRNHYELSQLDEKTSGILETLFQAMKEVLEADSMNRSKSIRERGTSLLKRKNLAYSESDSKEGTSEHKNADAEGKEKTDSGKNKKKKDPPGKGPPPGGAGDLDTAVSVEFFIAGDAAAVHDQSPLQSSSDDQSSSHSSKHCELRHFDKQEDKRKEGSISENKDRSTDENVDNSRSWFTSWIYIPYIAFLGSSSAHDHEHKNEKGTDVPSEKGQAESGSSTQPWYGSWISWNIFSKKNEVGCVDVSSTSKDTQESFSEKLEDSVAKSWTAYLSSWLVWPFVNKESLCQGEMDVVVQTLSSLPAEDKLKKEVQEMESKLQDGKVQEAESKLSVREVKETESKWQEREVHKTGSDFSDDQQQAGQEGAPDQPVEHSNIDNAVEIEDVSYSSLNKDTVWFLWPANALIKVYIWLLDTDPKYL